MDVVSEIKSRLSIDQLVSQYCQLVKRGRNFVALCPFHKDSHPSFLVSPDKGICYCFPCQKGGDIFSFYQLIEGVDFPQALKELAEKTGVELPDNKKEFIQKDEKDQVRACLQAAQVFFAEKLKANEKVSTYLRTRGVTEEEIVHFGIGYAPDSFDATYSHLLKVGFSRQEIVLSGLAGQKDLNDKMYDRFRHRLMFPIHDIQGRNIGFGGRTMGTDDAKYINSSDGPLYRKSSVLYGMHHALPAIRQAKRIILVEGYFDVIACHRVGIKEAVATCGTALTDEHVHIIKRYADTVVLCMDQDAAGKAAADKAFALCAKEGLRIEGVHMGDKDPADAVLHAPEEFRALLREGTKPYLSLVLLGIQQKGILNPTSRAEALERLLPMLQSISSATERMFALRESARALSTTEMALSDDLQRFSKGMLKQPVRTSAPSYNTAQLFNAAELTLGLILLHPKAVHIAEELIEPEDEFARTFHQALNRVANRPTWTLEDLELSPEYYHRASVLYLYCEESGFADWNDSIALKEIRKNCSSANKELLNKRKRELMEKMMTARVAGEKEQESELAQQYQDLLVLTRKAS